MEGLELLKQRRSTRDFINKPLDKDIVLTIIDAARYAPSAGNLQNWNFILVDKQNELNRIARLSLDQLWMSHASALVIVCGVPERAEKYYGPKLGKRYTLINGVFAASNMLHAAEALGINSIFVGAFNKYDLKKTLRIPDDVEVVGIIVLGKSSEKPKMPARYDLKSLVFLNQWKNKITDLKFQKLGRTAHHVEAAVKETKKTSMNIWDKSIDYVKSLISNAKEGADKKNEKKSE